MHRILVVDDSKSIRSLIEFALADLSTVKLTTAVDGSDALKKVQGGKFDLIITDVNMPNMNGLEFTRICRNQLGLSCPILILTTESEKSIRSKGREVGANGWIVKPFIPDALCNTVNKFLDIK